MGSFAAHDDPDAGRVAGQGARVEGEELPGQLGQVGVLGRFAVTVIAAVQASSGWAAIAACRVLSGCCPPADGQVDVHAVLAQPDDVVQERLGRPAVSVQIRIGLPWRCSSGICANAAYRTVMWSAALLAPALPARSCAARNSPVLSNVASIGW